MSQPFTTFTHPFQAVCEEMYSLAPNVGLHHDGVVFGSDDFCASIGGYDAPSITSSQQINLCKSLNRNISKIKMQTAAMELLIPTFFHMSWPEKNIYLLSQKLLDARYIMYIYLQVPHGLQMPGSSYTQGRR